MRPRRARSLGARVWSSRARRGGLLAALAVLAVPLLPVAPAVVAAARRAVGGAAARSGPVPGYVTVSPAPGSRTADPATEISFLGPPIGAIGTVSVVGSRSGRHLGRLLSYSTGDGASFVPARPFVPGEQVTVHTSLPVAHAAHGTFRFLVAHVVALRLAPTRPSFSTDVAGVDHFASAPTLEPPVVRVDVRTGAAPRVDLLLTPKGPTGQPGPMLVAPDGHLLWFKPLPPGQQAFDLNEQTLHGKPVLTWFQGRVVDGHGEGVAVIADEHYRTVAVVHGGNATELDLHELQLTNAGTAYVTAYRPVRWNLSSAHGSADGIAYALGSVQLLTGGDLVIGWGTAPHVTVMSASGAVRYDATLPAGDSSYRAVVRPWTGAPTSRPALVVARAVAGSGVTAAMSWNGATRVARWQVRAGRSPAGLRQVAVVASHGFETTARLAAVDKLVQVVALGAGGAPLGRSGVVRS